MNRDLFLSSASSIEKFERHQLKVISKYITRYKYTSNLDPKVKSKGANGGEKKDITLVNKTNIGNVGLSSLGSLACSHSLLPRNRTPPLWKASLLPLPQPACPALTTFSFLPFPTCTAKYI